jgi:Mg/Co/Ni transporter MgtE
MRAETLLAEAFMAAHPADAARALEALAAEDAAALLAGAEPDDGAAVVRRMAPGSGADCLARLAPERAADILAALPPDAAVALLRRLDPERLAALLGPLPPSSAESLRARLRFPEDSAGALADQHVLALPLDLSAGEALSQVRRTAHRVLHYVYVVDRDQRLCGVVSLPELMLAPTKAPLASTMRREVVRLPADAPRAVIVGHPGFRALHALPVVDADGTFVGALRYETLRRLEEDASGPRQGPDALATLLTLGELCWIGLTGVFVDLTTTLTPAPRAEGSEDHDGDRR